MSWSKDLFEKRWITIRGLSMHYCVSKRTSANEHMPAIVLLHGLGISHDYMLPTARLLTQKYQVYLPELPGVGESDKPDTLFDLPTQADILAEWMETIDLSHAAFLGNSMGCQIIAHLAVHHPHKISHAILISPTMDIRSPWMIQKLFLTALDIPFEPHSLLSLVLSDYLKSGIIRLFKMFHVALQDHIELQLPHMNIPTLVIRGGLDPLVSRSWAEEVTYMLPQGKLVIIPNAGHAVNYNSPVKLCALIQTFFEDYPLSTPLEFNIAKYSYGVISDD